MGVENSGDEMGTDQPEPRWFIDLDWYGPNIRNFHILIEDCLCPDCRRRLGVEGGEVSAAEIISNIGECCSKLPGFITGDMPILESIFRSFLANGNQPLSLEELGRELSEWRGGDTYRTSSEILSRLLKNERYYGIRRVTG
jgi:hypothetical protein